MRFNDRTGEEKYNNEGVLMKIVKYTNSHNIVVKFLDEYGAYKNTDYYSFTKGKVSNPNRTLHKIGEIGKNSQGCIMKIVEYTNAHNVIVEFQDFYKTRVHTNYDNFITGSVRNPYYLGICGVACIGNTKTKENGINKKSYSVWSSMIHRCYDEKYLKNKPTYRDKYVCDEWLCFENFEKWFNENYYEIENEVMCLDKDILVKGNKVYSPNTCIFVPNSINILVVTQNRSDKLLGVHKTKSNTYNAIYGDGSGNNVYLGAFNNEEDAFLAYKNGKEKFIKKTADKYKDKIPKKLYDTLYNWEIERNI